MEKRYQVFVSSTFADLQDERKKVIQTLLKLDCIPTGMELFPATDEDQFEFIKRIIDDCDYYLLIIGGRYGSVTSEGISYTELEYEYALERGLKVIALLHEKPEQIPNGKSEQNPELRIRLESFRDKVANGRLVKFWQTAEALPFISTSGNHEYNWYQISQKILREIFPDKTVNNFSVSEIENMADELTMYGFLTKTKNYIPAVPNNANSGLSIMQHGYDRYQLIYSPKLERYKYWLKVNGKMPEHIEFTKNEQ